MIQTRWAARAARRHAHALIDWRADVACGARIGPTALEVDLPKRYRLDPKWVHDHVFLWDVNRRARLTVSDANWGHFEQRLRGLIDGEYHG